MELKENLLIKRDTPSFNENKRVTRGGKGKGGGVKVPPALFGNWKKVL